MSLRQLALLLTLWLPLSLPAAENVLNDLDDGFRVRSDVTSEGVIIYEFPEVMHRPQLGSGDAV